MTTKKELFEIWKVRMITESISSPLEVLTLIILWYIQYITLFWILLFIFISGAIRWIVKQWKLENKLKELNIEEVW